MSIFHLPSALGGWLHRLRHGETAPAAAEPPPGMGASRLGNILTVPDAWQTVEGFHQPTWSEIRKYIDGRACNELDRQTLWHDASLQWLHRLQQDLDAHYHIAESQNFLLLSARPGNSAKYILGECESILLHLRARLGGAAWRWKYGKHAILMFAQEDIFYRYISHFYPEDGEYRLVSGVFLQRGYCHTALPYRPHYRGTLVHEFVHLCLCHLRTPVWLAEGLACYLERELTDPRAETFDLESAKAQRAFWNSRNLWDFWSGLSFHNEASAMSYNLAELLVGTLWREFGDLTAFILSAKKSDSGEGAARKHLDISLGELAGGFLGDGNWQPHVPKFSSKEEGESPT